MHPSFDHLRICFLGAGSMAEAIIRGLTQQKQIGTDHIYVVNRSNQEKLQELRRRYGVQVSGDPEQKNQMIKQADIVVLAMKPKDAKQAISDIHPLINKAQLMISMIAGLSIRVIQQQLGQELPVARTMPNTSSTIGLGATGISFSSQVSKAHRQFAMDIFQSVGIVQEVEENLLDIVTGISGSGPAYIYYMIEAMIGAGVEGGLRPETARELTLQTVLGAAQMVKSTEEDPAVLRRKVTSPGGTTQAALETLDQHQFPEIVGKAVLRAAEKAKEIGESMNTKG